jgi:hypothetical protein
METFHEEIRRRKQAGARVFVVELTGGPPELAELRGYRFWAETR